jgi:hypothetical protein
VAADAGGSFFHTADGGQAAHFIVHKWRASMKPEHQERRKIIREWMALPQDKRRTEVQVESFARKAMGRIAFRPDPYRQIVSWVRPRAGRQ